MSWDVFVQDFPSHAKTVAEIPDDFQPAPIGRRSDLIRKILQVVPTADFSNPAWGLIDGGDWSMEVNMGGEEDCDGFALHVRGGDVAVGVVAAILEKLGLRALNSQTGEFFVAGAGSVASFQKWRAYRDQVVGESKS
jgi:hypothetical protein